MGRSYVQVITLCVAAVLSLTSGRKCSGEVIKRTAEVLLQNSTGKPLEYVVVSHKYSNDYKNTHLWIIAPKDSRSPDDNLMTVDYHTGFGTTGSDWWLVTWKFVGEEQIYCSQEGWFPRDVVDELEQVVDKSVEAALVAAGVAGSIETGVPAAIGAKFGKEAGEKLTAGVFNTESTKGYKKHTLRAEDATGNDATVIEITPDSVIFSSPSGKSETTLGPAS